MDLVAIVKWMLLTMMSFANKGYAACSSGLKMVWSNSSHKSPSFSFLLARKVWVHTRKYSRKCRRANFKFAVWCRSLPFVPVRSDYPSTTSYHTRTYTNCEWIAVFKVHLKQSCFFVPLLIFFESKIQWCIVV